MPGKLPQATRERAERRIARLRPTPLEYFCPRCGEYLGEYAAKQLADAPMCWDQFLEGTA